MNRIKKIIGFSILGAYIVAMTSFVNVTYNARHCSDIDIIIKDSLNTHFVQDTDIEKIIAYKKYDLDKKRPDEINLHEIESSIEKHPSIKDCDCYFLANSTMCIVVTQRRPIARIMTNKQNFYIDDRGEQMPISNFYTAHVPIITGNVKTEIIKTDLFNIIEQINSDSFWNAQIVQIEVEANGEYTLIPRAGRQRIELGTAENLDIKFQSLKALYLQVFNNNSWNKYKTISLKYDGQVVCTKK